MSDEKFDDLQFLEEDYLEWPCYPICPVKSRTHKADDGVGPLIGIVVAGVPIVYLKNMLEFSGGYLEPQLERVDKREYKSFKELVADGWIVD